MGMDLLYKYVHNFDTRLSVYKNFEETLYNKIPRAKDDYDFHCAKMIVEFNKMAKTMRTIDQWYSFVVNVDAEIKKLELKNK